MIPFFGRKMAELTFCDYREQILVDHLMGKTDTLARVLDRSSPDAGIPEFLGEIAVELVADVLDRASFPDDEGFLEISIAAMGF